MSHVSSMLDTYPKDLGTADRESLGACIAACEECAQTCTACADACLAEDMVADLRRCIGLNLDCADVCAATAAVLSRQTAFDTELTRSVLQACAAACQKCGDECAAHADMHEHCRLCAEVCRKCRQACDDLLSSLG